MSGLAAGGSLSVFFVASNPPKSVPVDSKMIRWHFKKIGVDAKLSRRDGKSIHTFQKTIHARQKGNCAMTHTNHGAVHVD
jgi:hypothetical protein